MIMHVFVVYKLFAVMICLEIVFAESTLEKDEPEAIQNNLQLIFCKLKKLKKWISNFLVKKYQTSTRI